MMHTKTTSAKYALILLLAAPWMMGSNCSFFKTTPTKSVTYAQGAKQLYEQGRKQLKGGNYDVARKVFQRLKTKYPFSGFATLAELGIADTYFSATKYLQAIDAYKLFAKLHPSHPRTPYAAFQIGHGYYKLRPWDWILAPSSHEKDATTTRQAIEALRAFLRTYPTSKNVKQAKTYLQACLDQLVKHEMYVARFYAVRGKYRAVAWRMAHLLKKYPQTRFADEAQYRMLNAYLRLKEPKKAQSIFTTLKTKHPKSQYVKTAQRDLARWKNPPPERPMPSALRPSPPTSRPISKPKPSVPQ